MLKNAHTIDNFLKQNDFPGKKAQVGVDLHLKAVKRVAGGHVGRESTTINDYTLITADRYGYYFLRPGTYSVTFKQGVRVPPDSTALIIHRSSLLRCGALITSGVYDPGFETDHCGAVMVVTCPLTIEEDSRLAQIVFVENEPVDGKDLYNGQWQGGKDVK